MSFSDKREPIVNWAVKDGVLAEEHKLTVVNTSADGNCFFHSIMLGLVGISDLLDDPTNSASRGLLRRMNGRFLSANEDELRRGLESLNDASKDKEFVDAAAEVAEALGYTKKHGVATEPLNTFAMANALFRPIIVYAVAFVASPRLRTGLGSR